VGVEGRGRTGKRNMSSGQKDQGDPWPTQLDKKKTEGDTRNRKLSAGLKMERCLETMGTAGRRVTGNLANR